MGKKPIPANVNQVEPGDIIEYTNYHHDPITNWRYTHRIVRVAPVLVFFTINGDDSRVFCLRWEKFWMEWEWWNAKVIAQQNRNVPL